jgi:glycosyltransferase involved in cell wall biosynthesis
MKQLTLSVVMSVYNAEKYLDVAIQSILSQTFTDFEFIIINDGSSDNSFNIIKKYQETDQRIVLISRENKGLIFSLNEGVELAKGKYIARMDADDISHINRFEFQLAELEKETADICGCHYFLINKDDKLIDTILVPLDNESLCLYLAFAIPFAHGSVIIRKQFLTDNCLSYGQCFEYAEDKYLWIQMFQKGAAFTNVNDVLFYYREIQESKSRIESKEMYLDDKNIKNLFLKNNLEEVNSAYQSLSSKFETLSIREQEHLLDLCLLLGKSKRSIFRKATSRQKVIAVFKYMSKFFK